MIVDKIRAAIQEEIHWIAPKFFATSDNMRAALRIEMDFDTFPKLMHDPSSFDVGETLYSRKFKRQEGALIFEGVPLFRVEWLPAPGWRVVNVIRKLTT